MKNLLLLLVAVSLIACEPLPENKKSCWAPAGNGTCLQQLFDDLADDEQFYFEYEVDFYHSLKGMDVDGKVILKIDDSFYYLAKQRGKGNYPSFDQGFEALYRSGLVETKYSERVEVDLTEYKFQ